MVQQCPRTHGGRILRHDAVAKQIAGALSSSGWDVERVRLYHMPSDQGKKPDVVAIKPDGSAIILDVQVVSGSVDMEQTWRAKISKYDRNDLRQAISELKGVAPNNIKVMAATVSWLGVWCEKVPRSFSSWASRQEYFVVSPPASFGALTSTGGHFTGALPFIPLFPLHLPQHPKSPGPASGKPGRPPQLYLFRFFVLFNGVPPPSLRGVLFKKKKITRVHDCDLTVRDKLIPISGLGFYTQELATVEKSAQN